MTQIDVTLTDYLLTAECIALSVFLTRQNAANLPARHALIAFFYSLAAATAFGGAVHGFFSADGAVHDLLWLLTMVALGCVACSGWTLFAYGTFASPTARIIVVTAAVGLAVYVSVVVFVNQDFAVAIATYLPASFAVAAMFLTRALRSRTAPAWHGLAGMLLTFLAAGIQQAGVDLHPRYFNHNALYHLVQAIGLVLIYRGGAWIVGQSPPSRSPGRMAQRVENLIS